MRRLLFASVFFIGACNQNLPRYDEVKDLRIIGMRANPPTFLFDRPAAGVTFDALVLNPLGGALEFAWSSCPVESGKACTDFDELRLRAAPADRDALDAAHALTVSGTAEYAPASPDVPASEALRPYAIQSFVLSQAELQPLMAYYAQQDLFGFGMGVWPSAVLSLSSADGDHILAAKRWVASIADLSVFNDLPAEVKGTAYAFCPPGEPGGSAGTEGTAGAAGGADAAGNCIPWDPALAGNNNPVFATIRWSAGKSSLADWQDLPADGPLQVKSGGEIRLLPVMTPESFETYQIVRTDLQNRTIEVESAVEDPSISWFVTAGKLQDAITWDKFTRTLDTVYTAPDVPPENTGGMVAVWMVARDQRGGESWTHVDLQIVP